MPVFERFYGGGIGSMRGFAYRGVSPRQGSKDQAVGGDFLLLGGTEVSYPLFGKDLRGVFFSDMGTVERDFEITSWRVSVGFGVRFVLRLFGPVPMSFDFGIPDRQGWRGRHPGVQLLAGYDALDVYRPPGLACRAGPWQRMRPLCRCLLAYNWMESLMTRMNRWYPAAGPGGRWP